MVELFLPVAQTLVETPLCKCLGGSLRSGGGESSVAEGKALMYKV